MGDIWAKIGFGIPVTQAQKFWLVSMNIVLKHLNLMAKHTSNYKVQQVWFMHNHLPA